MKSHIKNVIDAKPKSRPINPLASSAPPAITLRFTNMAYYSQNTLQLFSYTLLVNFSLCDADGSLLYEAGTYSLLLRSRLGFKIWSNTNTFGVVIFVKLLA